jgi:alkylation response protein AidB-like acyl-CoA dehydrogenase
MNLEHLLTEEQRQMRATLREFTRKEIIPRARDLEADYALVEEIHQKLVDMGIQAAGYPAEYGGGGGLSPVMQVVIGEELARGDGGIAMTASVNAGAVLSAAIHANNRAVMDRFIPLFTRGKLAYACLAMTDEAGGADTENPLLHGAGIKTTARLEGNEWVINGNKSWPTHGGIAEVYITVCTTDPKAGDEGLALIYVPRDAPGLSFGKPEKKMVYRTVINGSVYYDDVRVPKDYRAAGPGADAQLFHAAIDAGSQLHTAIQALGITERAFEIVLEYTGARMGGFKPVRQHSIAAGIIADMAIGIQMMKAGVYNLAAMFESADFYGPMFSPQFISKAAALRVFCADAGVELINKGAELLGSMAISEKFPYEKCLRDIKILQLWLGGQQICRYRVASGYYDLKNWA